MKKTLVFVTLLMCFILTKSADSETDSLLPLLDTPLSEKERVRVYNDLSEKLFHQNTDTAFYFAHNAYRLASELNYIDGLITAADNLSFFNFSLGNYDTALAFSDEAISLCKKHGKEKRSAYCYTTKANIFGYLHQNDSAAYYYHLASDIAYKFGDKETLSVIYNNYANHLNSIARYEKALDYYLRSLKIMREGNKRRSEAVIIANIAGIYMQQSNFDLALEQFKKALDINKELENYIEIASNYNSFGLVYNELKKYEKAIEFFRKALEINKTLSIKAKQAMNYYNIAYNYSLMHEYDSARVYYPLSIALCKEIGMEPGLAFNYLGLGMLYSAQNNVSKAAHYLEEALAFSLKYDMKEQQLNSYDELYKLHKANNNHLEALKYFELYYAVKNDLFTLEKESIIAELQTQYETEIKKNKIIELQQRERINRLRQRVGILLISLILLGFVFLFLYYRKTRIIHRQQLVIKTQELEKTRQALESNKQELTGKALSLVKSDEIIQQLKKDIADLLPSAEESVAGELYGFLQRLHTSDRSRELWQEFETRFNELNDGFINKLLEKSSKLSPAEIRLCALLRLQLSTKEIAEISNRSARTIEYTRSNVRKKLGISPDVSLTSYLLSI